ncbi:MAG TPA: hypothetical protein VMU96_04275 [Casimicrobiaceae bacterium]|nr:hypothetical protein [Casimicrobiaceae bacterium]
MPARHDLIIGAASFALALAVTSTAAAQTGAPATTTAPPAPNCEKPGEPPPVATTESGRSAAEAKRNNWFKGMRSYVDCLKAFISEEQAAAATHVKAASAAAEELNKSAKAFNDYAEATKQ